MNALQLAKTRPKSIIALKHLLFINSMNKIGAKGSSVVRYDDTDTGKKPTFVATLKSEIKPEEMVLDFQGVEVKWVLA